MRWPSHLRMSYHDPMPQVFDFPLKFGTYGSPPSKYPISHRLIKTFAFSASDISEFQNRYIEALKLMHTNPERLSSLMKPELYAKVSESLQRLKAEGFRTKLINQWDGVLEWGVYGYMRYEGISPFSQQNFPYSNYKIHQINVFHLPIRMEFTLDKRVLQSDQPTTALINYENPFNIRNLPKESAHLHLMLEKYPIYIISVDIGLLSKCKFHIIDLYSQCSIAEGEKTGDEFEFHIFRYEKVFPKDITRYKSESEYQRFMDSNFKSEQFNWMISDIDQYMQYLPISSSS